MTRLRFIVVFALMVLLLLVFAPVVLASTGAAPPAEAQAAWGLLVAALVPFVTGLLVKKTYSKLMKSLVAFMLAAIVGVVTVYVSGQWDGDAWAIVLACYAVAQVVFWAVIEKVPGLKEWLLSHFNT
jgi:hypothetical protein